MKCDEARELFSEYLEGSMKDYSAWDALEQHMDQCDSCRCELEHLRQTWEMVDALPSVDPPADFRHNLVMRAAKLQHEQQKADGNLSALNGLLSKLFPARSIGFACAAAVLAVVLFKVSTPVHQFTAGLGDTLQIMHGLNHSNKSASESSASKTISNESKSAVDIWRNRKDADNTLWVDVQPKDQGDGRMLYRITLSLNKNALQDGVVCGRLATQVSLLHSDQSAGDSEQSSNVVWSGNVLPQSPVVVPVIVDKSQDMSSSVNLLVRWDFHDQHISKVIYIPSHDGSVDNVAKLNDLHADIGSSLQAVSKDYGVIIVANGGISSRIATNLVHMNDLGETLNTMLKPCKLSCIYADHIVYVDNDL